MLLGRAAIAAGPRPARPTVTPGHRVVLPSEQQRERQRERCQLNTLDR